MITNYLAGFRLRFAVTSRFGLQVQDAVIPSIEGNPIKCLGKWFNASLTDGTNVAEAADRGVAEKD